MKVKMKIVISGLIVIGIGFLFYYNICSILYYKQKVLIEYYYGNSIPTNAIITENNIYYADDFMAWYYQKDEMTEKDVLYEVQDEDYNVSSFYDISTDSLYVINESMFDDSDIQELYFAFLVDKADIEKVIPNRSDVCIYKYDNIGVEDLNYSDNEIEYSISDRAEMQILSESGRKCRSGIVRTQSLTIAKSILGKYEVKIKLSFTKWELENLGINSISNTD